MRDYVYACKVLPENERDVAHAYQNAPREHYAAEIGEIRQLSVSLSDEGYREYLKASNLVELEEVVEGGVPDEPRGEEASVTDAEIQGVQIPPREDTDYGRSTWLREGKQGKGIKFAVIDTALTPAVARILAPYIEETRSWVGGNGRDGKHYHGGHVAATATQENAKLLHYATLNNQGRGRSDHALEAINRAVDKGARFINMSLAFQGGPMGFERAARRALDKGCVVIAAGGNEALRGNPKMYPAGCESVLAVAAKDRNTDRRARFSSYHSYVDIAHVGVSVLSYGGNGSHYRASGTSMASPNVTWCMEGLAAESEVYGRELVKQVLASARDTSEPAIYEGHGAMDARAAHNRLQRSEPKEPEVWTGSRWKWLIDNSAPAPAVLTYKGKPAWRVERIGR